jgi:hypothetical protein
MFDFKKKVLNPLIGATTAKIDEALKTPTITDRIEALFSVKEEANASFSKMVDSELSKSATTILLLAAGAIISVALNVPAALLGLVTLAVGGMVVKKIGDSDATRDNARKIENTITTEVLNLATAYPQEAIKSPRFLKALKERFNLASASETEVNQLLLALASTRTPPADAPAAKSPTPSQGGRAGIIAT